VFKNLFLEEFYPGTFYPRTLNEVTMRPKKVAVFQKLGDLRITSLKRLPYV